MIKKLLLLTLLLWLPIAQANDAKLQRGIDAYRSEDYKTARAILKPLAEKGDATAQKWFGSMYNNGNGVPQNYGKAAKWYSKAAKQGHAEAQYNLGQMYALGQGVPANGIYAYMWLNLAKANDKDTPEYMKQALNETLSSEDIVKAQDLATKCWESNYKDCTE